MKKGFAGLLAVCIRHQNGELRLLWAASSHLIADAPIGHAWILFFHKIRGSRQAFTTELREGMEKIRWEA